MLLMCNNIGKITDHVNGHYTARTQLHRRSYYRMALNHVLRRVEQRLKDLDLTAAAASKMAGLSQDAIRNMQRAARQQGGRHGVSTKTIEALAPVLQTTVSWLMEGEADDLQPRDEFSSGQLQRIQKVALISVKGEAAAGLWREVDTWDEAKYPPVPVVPGRYSDLEQFAYKIIGSSVDKLGIHDGDFVTCVPYFMARVAPTDSDVVIVERRRGGEVEVSCKQLVVRPPSIELWPRSTNPQYQKPLTYEDGSDGTEVEIVGLVIGVYRSMFT